MTNIELLISLFIIILIIIIKIIITKKYKNIYKKDLYNKSRKFNLFLYIISIILFAIAIVINSRTETSTLTIIVNSLSIAIITIPLSINTLYFTSFNNEEITSHIKTIITNIYDSKMIKKFNRAGINVIVLTTKKIKSKILTLEEDEMKNISLNKNLIIKTDNKKIISKKENTIYEFENLNNAYELIYNSRGVHDNYIRTIKYNITSYLPLLICYIVFSIAGFPIIYNLLLMLLLKLYTMLVSEFVYKKMPYDSDLMTRKPKPSNIFIGGQEILLSIIESFCIAFTISIPYMFILAEGASRNLANTLLFTIYIYINIFMTYAYVSEKSFIVNFIKALTNIRLIVYLIISVLLTISFNFINIFTTRNIGLQNYFGSIAFALIPVLIFELTKFTRFITTRKK